MYKAGQTTLALAAYLLASTATANTISLANYKGSNNQFECTPSCEGFIGTNPGTISLSLTHANDYQKNGNSSTKAELARLNELLAQSNLAEASVSFVNKTDTEANIYSTSRQYFSIKKSKNLWFFENTSGGEVTIRTQGNAWSHATEYGSVVVPVPAAALLFGSALAGLFGVGRMRKKSA